MGLMINEIISSLSLARSLIEDALVILHTLQKEEPDYLTSFHLQPEMVFSKFSFKEEILTILSIAAKYFDKRCHAVA